MNIAQMFLLASTCWLCAQEIWQRKKNILRRCGSTEIIAIFTLARNPSGTAETDILTLLHDFYANSQTAKVTSTRKVENFFHHALFEVLAIVLWRHWRTQTGEKLKKHK